MKNFLFLLSIIFLFIHCGKEAAPLPDVPTEEESTLDLTPEAEIGEIVSAIRYRNEANYSEWCTYSFFVSGCAYAKGNYWV